MSERRQRTIDCQPIFQVSGLLPREELEQFRSHLRQGLRLQLVYFSAWVLVCKYQHKVLESIC